ncbi:MAG: tail fiber protein [Spirochaetales bacterium]|nr:tail fiber protein [Spirochaetales bacterium]
MKNTAGILLKSTFVLFLLAALSVSCDVASGGGGAEIETLEIRYIICVSGGDDPYGGGGPYVANAMLGEIRVFAGSTAPPGWAFCEGNLLTVGANAALFAVLGTTYGGDGVVTFAIPDLRGKVVIHPSP